MTVRGLIRRNRFLCALFMAGALFVGTARVFGSRVVVQVTPSMPRGVYWVERSRQIARGDIIVFEAPADARMLIAARHWWRLSVGYLLMKPVVARKGDRVRVSVKGLFIDSVFFGPVEKIDTEGLPLPLREMDRVLSDGEYFTASPYEHSFDSRYFGIIRREAIKGVARRLM